MIKYKGFCDNCGCRFIFREHQAVVETDMFGKKTIFVTCPICGKHVEPKKWKEIPKLYSK